MRHEHNVATGETIELEDAPTTPATPEQIKDDIKQKIRNLESSITERNKREYVKGLKYPADERFFYSVKKVDKVDADIELLRAEL